MKRKKIFNQKDKKSNSGIALFMVMSTLAVLSVLIADLTYTVHVNSRMAYNSIDNLKAYYLAKAGYRLSLLRLKAYLSIQNTLNQNKSSPIAKSIPSELIDMIWNIPFLYPIPVMPKMTLTQKEAIEKFTKESSLSGSFTTIISAESSKINLNNIFLKEINIEQDDSKTSSQDQSTTVSPSTSQATTASNPQNPTKQKTQTTKKEIDFRPFLESIITSTLEAKKTKDREFSDIYRNVQGKDIVSAIYAYLFPNEPNSELPGFKPIQPKNAPFYSLTELHLIPGIDDTLYDLLSPLFTTFTTVGIHVNSADKHIFHALFPEATDEDIANLMRKRDDPDVGKPWTDADSFWKDAESVLSSNIVQAAKDRLDKVGLKIITNEKSFKITVIANQGLSTKRLEAYVVITDPKDSKKSNQNPNIMNPSSNFQSNSNNTSTKKNSSLNLVYWRVL
jgi:type II secretory pathway component PulK